MMMSMATRRALNHKWLVTHQKAVRHLTHHKADRYEYMTALYYLSDFQRISGPRWRTINRAQTALEYAAMKMMNGYGFTREETEQAIKILGLETGRRKA